MTAVRRLWPLPGWWYVILATALLMGTSLIVFNPVLPVTVTQSFAPQVRTDRWAVLFGLIVLGMVFSHIAGAVARYVLAVLLRLTGDITPADAWSPAVVGVCEAVMYPLALVIGKGEFIGVWLAVKVAGQWTRWSGDPSSTGTTDLDALNQGRRRFNAFLVGNAISIMFGVVVWLLVRALVAQPPNSR